MLCLTKLQVCIFSLDTQYSTAWVVDKIKTSYGRYENRLVQMLAEAGASACEDSEFRSAFQDGVPGSLYFLPAWGRRMILAGTGNRNGQETDKQGSSSSMDDRLRRTDCEFGVTYGLVYIWWIVCSWRVGPDL